MAVPANTIGVVGFVSARVNDFLLSGYKLFIDDALINIGPGRGEAPVWGGDGVFRSLPVQTLDLTAVLTAGGSHVLALQTMHQNGPSVMLEVQMTCADGATTAHATVRNTCVCAPMRVCVLCASDACIYMYAHASQRRTASAL